MVGIVSMQSFWGLFRECAQIWDIKGSVCTKVGCARKRDDKYGQALFKVTDHRKQQARNERHRPTGQDGKDEFKLASCRGFRASSL